MWLEGGEAVEVEVVGVESGWLPVECVMCIIKWACRREKMGEKKAEG